MMSPIEAMLFASLLLNFAAAVVAVSKFGHIKESLDKVYQILQIVRRSQVRQMNDIEESEIYSSKIFLPDIQMEE